ncbi:hypothetical protein NKR23_g11785 [Pleurostoma richardsiae]|uniref:Uncharacterized protein n=1 Tax=Pleurostoma richardsiae TaxID=41990 RepID=A0AA38VB88_9PEZI|nr:hypothetical protein NKR23_g11785 [Pleurostoma richardsiae]
MDILHKPTSQRSRPLRVEKPRRAHRDNHSLPTWYYRIQSTIFKEDRDVTFADFDEDLSELEEDKTAESSEDDDEDCSERSHDGSDASWYYELKDMREELKRERLRERKKKIQQREYERVKEEEVGAASMALEKAEGEHRIITVGPLANQSFELFCGDHVEYFFSDLFPTKRIDFYYLDDMNGSGQEKLGSEADVLYGDVYLNAEANCNFGPFRPPTRASQNVVKVKSCDGKYDLHLKFIGKGYLKLRVSREMVFMNPYRASPTDPPSAAPEVFEFVGVLRDLEKERADRQKRLAKARRSPSPRESWFELNHPMGWWNQSRQS